MLPIMPSILERYERAAALTPDKLAALVRNRRVAPRWTGDGDVFWYEREAGEGTEFVLVDPLTATTTLIDAPATSVTSAATPGVLQGPDGRGLRCRDHDLWLVVGDDERQLTFDGEVDFAWGALPADSNMVVPFRRMGLVLPPAGTVHSPSGRLVFTMRVDERCMRTRHMVEHVSASGARPECHEWKMQLEDEGDPPPSECRIYNLETSDWVKVDVSDGLGGNVFANGASEVTWSPDENLVYLLHARMGGSRAVLVEIDTRTGARREAVVLEEAPLYEANQFLYSLPLVHVMPSTGEAILFSQRSGWGHLYLYDLSTGECKNQISAGAMTVRDLVYVDEERREITFVGGTDESGCIPLWRRVYRAAFDGSMAAAADPRTVRPRARHGRASILCPHLWTGPGGGKEHQPQRTLLRRHPVDRELASRDRAS